MVLIFILSFFVGSIPFGLIVARLFQVKNLTTQGSGNIGASNVSRVVGFWPAGLMTFSFDVAKGVFAVLLALPFGSGILSLLLGGFDGVIEYPSNSIVPWSAGFFVVFGHCFSPWLRFKGGKGVATGLGVMLVLSPISALFGFLGFVFTFLFSRIASLSSIVGLILSAVCYLVMNSTGVHLFVGAAIIFLILIRHEANIDALLDNREKIFQ